MPSWLDEFKKHQSLFIDFETGGLEKGHVPFSFAGVDYATGAGQDYFGILNPGDKDKFSAFSKRLIDQSDWGKAEKVFLRDVVKEKFAKIGSSGGSIVGHNILGFDIPVAAELLGKETIAKEPLKNIFGFTQDTWGNSAYKFDTLFKQGIRAKGVYAADGPKNFFAKSYEAYSGYIQNRLATGQTALVDTMKLTQIAMGMAQEKGLVDFGWDVNTGTKLDSIGAAIRLPKVSHISVQDVKKQTIPIFDWVTGVLDDLSVGKLSAKDKTSFEKIASIQPKLREINFRKGIYEHAYDFVKTGKVEVDKPYHDKTQREFLSAPENKRLRVTSDNPQDFFSSTRFKGKRGRVEKLFNEYENWIQLQLKDAKTAGRPEKFLLDHFSKKEDKLISGIRGSLTDINKPAAVSTSKAIKGNWWKWALGAGGAWVVFNAISGKDDDYNTISGLHEGGMAGKIRKKETDFGSGYQGLNPRLSPDYNEAQDVSRYEQFRASKIGLPEAEIYQWMTQQDKEASEYAMASASAGTAMHNLIAAQSYRDNPGYESEKLTYSLPSGIAGHIDEKTAMGIGDIKTVTDGIYRSILRDGKPKPMHEAQVQFYLGSQGEEQGYIRYINRDKPWQEKTFTTKFNPYSYEQQLRKVERAKMRVLAGVESGKLLKSDLPMTASFETLQKHDAQKESPSEMVNNLAEYSRITAEEMRYVNSIRRGMPSSGEGYERVQKRNREKRESWMKTTQGIGFQLFNDRQGHHIM